MFRIYVEGRFHKSNLLMGFQRVLIRRLTHLGLCGNWLVDTNERGYVQDFVEDSPTFGWGKMSERSSRGKIEMVCRLLVKTSIKMLEQ